MREFNRKDHCLLQGFLCLFQSSYVIPTNVGFFRQDGPFKRTSKLLWIFIILFLITFSEKFKFKQVLLKSDTKGKEEKNFFWPVPPEFTLSFLGVLRMSLIFSARSMYSTVLLRIVSLILGFFSSRMKFAQNITRERERRRGISTLQSGHEVF